jgi:hypothetical protein
MADIFNGNESLTRQEQEAFLALGMLRNVAIYLNPEGWKYVPEKNKGHYFYINTSSNVGFSVDDFTASYLIEPKQSFTDTTETLSTITLRG